MSTFVFCDGAPFKETPLIRPFCIRLYHTVPRCWSDVFGQVLFLAKGFPANTSLQLMPGATLGVQKPGDLWVVSSPRQCQCCVGKPQQQERHFDRLLSMIESHNPPAISPVRCKRYEKKTKKPACPEDYGDAGTQERQSVRVDMCIRVQRVC